MSYKHNSIFSNSLDLGAEEYSDVLKQVSLQQERRQSLNRQYSNISRQQSESHHRLQPQDITQIQTVTTGEPNDSESQNQDQNYIDKVLEDQNSKPDTTISYETNHLLLKALPCSAQNLIYYICKLTTIAIVGHHFGNLELSAVSLGSTFANVTGFSVIQGLVSVLDTYCSQSFTGNIKMTGIYLQKCLIINSLVCIFIALIWVNSYNMFMVLRIQSDVSYLAQSYLRCSILGMPGNIIFMALQRFLQAQQIFYPVFFIQLINLPLYLGVQYIFVNSSLGFIGAPLAVSFCDTVVAVIVVIYAAFFNGYQAWDGFSFKALEGLPEYLYLSIGTVVQVCSDWWAFEVTTIACGWISVSTLATQSIMMSTFSLLFSMQFGISVAVGNRIGNYLGQGQYNVARTLTKIALTITLVSSSIVTIILILVKQQWAQIFTKNQEIIQETMRVLPYAAGASILDAINITINGVLRGTGRQTIGAIVNTIAYYVIGLPIAYFLAFKVHMGLIGIWLGLIIGLSCQSSALTIYTFSIDYRQAAIEAQDRIQETVKVQNQSQDELTQPLII